MKLLIPQRSTKVIEARQVTVMSEPRLPSRGPYVPGGGGTPKGILVVDDNEAVRTLLREVLETQRYLVFVAATVQDAEAILQRYGPEGLGLVITDVHLTEEQEVLEGYRLYERWATQHAAMTFLLISGDPGSYVLPAIAAGTVSFLAKPFTIEAVLNTVHILFPG